MNKTTQFLLMLAISGLLTCSRDWKNPLDTDEDLKHTPQILSIQLNSEDNIVINLDYSYSDSSKIILERKDSGAFETISYIRQSQATLVDTLFDKESNHNFTYRVRVEKGEYRTAYSEARAYQYTSESLNAPTNFLAITVELQGIRLKWNDRSNNEESYKIERDEGSGFSEIAALLANSKEYFDDINNLNQNASSIMYRVQAYGQEASSQWVEVETVYPWLSGPTNLRITNSSSSNFTIEWDDNSNIETGYIVERKMNNLLFEEIAELLANEILYVDTLSDTGLFSYRVRAKKDALYSSYSNVVSNHIQTLIPTDGLVAYYPFNGNANDESGNGNNGTVHGATLTTDRFGNINGAYNLDGIDDFIDIGNSNSLKPNLPLSFSAWVKLNNQDIQPIMMNNFHENSYFGAWLSVVNSNPTIHFGDGGLTEPSSRRSKLGSSILALGIWYHLVGVIRGATDMDIYVNGVNDGGSYDGTGGSLAYSNGPGAIGKHDGSGVYPPIYFNGGIDDIRIYSRTLTNLEILALYHEGD